MILVTGASGMLGAQLCRRLCAAGQSVRALTRRPLTHPLLDGLSLDEIPGDLNDLSAINQAMTGCESVYHVAGMISYHNRDWQQLREVNAVGTTNILNAARDAGVQRVVCTSSSAAVGWSQPEEPILNEDSPFLPAYQKVPYMQTKREGEEIARKFEGLEVVCVNPVTIYGAGDVKMNTGVVFEKIKRGKLKFCPPGGTSVVSVTDCVTGHLLAMNKGKPGERYLLSTSHHSFGELFAMIAAAVDAKAPTRTLPAWLYSPAYLGMRIAELFGGNISRHIATVGFKNRYFSAEKAKQELGWQPTQTAQEMLNEAAEFYREQGLI